MCGFKMSSRISSPVMGLTTRMFEVLDEQDDAGSGVGSAYSDVVQPAAVAQGDRAGLVNRLAFDMTEHRTHGRVSYVLRHGFPMS